MRYLKAGIFLTGILLMRIIFAANNMPDRSCTLSGHIYDGLTGEELIGVNIYVIGQKTGTVSNSYGFYSITLPAGQYELGYSYVGYTSCERKINLNSDQNMNVELFPALKQIDEIQVTAVKRNDNVSSLEMGTSRLTIREINKIPAFMGEIDLVKAIQLLPGINTTSEGSTGFSVRGGNSDQNLILLDEATVYNVSHLLGFFSVFNNDAVKDAKIYKGDIPANYGGRLSSLLEVRMKEGNMKNYAFKGGAGLISSRFTAEGPIVKDKASFVISGRRTYADLFLPLAKNRDVRKSKLFFYDFNAKVNQIINNNNRIYISGYLGRDVFRNEYAKMGFGNHSLTMRWNHLFSNKLFSNFCLIDSKYSYELGTPSNEENGFSWNSSLRDNGFKADFTYYPGPQNTVKFGLISTFHTFKPGTAQGTGTENSSAKFVLPANYALESGIYLMSDYKAGRKLSFTFGMRYSIFQNIGKATVYHYDNNFIAKDTSFFQRGQFYNYYGGIEPRLGVTFLINNETSVKTSFAHSRQYLQLAQNSASGTPLDIWFPASINIKPQISNQISVGFYKNFRFNIIESSVEAYYKKMQNTIDFRDHAMLLLNPLLEGEVRIGSSWSYGLEFMVKINEKRLNGWISYTLSKTLRQINGINYNEPYPAPYDKPNDIAIVMNYRLSKKVLLGGNWVYSTGVPITYPVGRYDILGSVIPVYSKRNANRMPDYHRLDLSVTIQGKSHPGKKWQGEWNFSIYNAYGRKNAWAINFLQDKNNPDITYAEKTYLFSVLPSLTYNFNF